MTAIRFFPSTVRGVDIDPILSGLVEYWKFDSNTTGEFGSTEVSSSNVSLGAGKINDGAVGTAGAFLQYADDNRFSFTDGVTDLPFSVSMWVYVNSWAVTGNWLFSKRPATGSTNEYQFYIDDNTGTVRCQLFSGGGSGVYIGKISTTALSLSTWYHITFTYDGSESSSGIKIYINGTLETTTNLNSGTYLGMVNNTEPTQLFRLGTNTNTSHKGIIDEVGIWKNRELTATEVLSLYNSGSGIQYPF